MPENKSYIKKIKLTNGDIKYLRDEEAVHSSELESILDDYLPKSGGDITGDVNITGDVSITGGLTLPDITEKTTTISNVLTKDSDDSVKYHSTDNFLQEIGGIGKVSVDNNNTVIYTVGKN